jgi:hypothetical protein
VEKPSEEDAPSFGTGFGRSAFGGYSSSYGGSSYGGSVYGARGAASPATQKKTYYSAPAERTPIRQSAPPSQERLTVGKPLAPQKSTAQKELFSAGDRVRHITFGEGEIISVKPMGADTLYEIVFDRVGTKKLMATYAKLKKL